MSKDLIAFGLSPESWTASLRIFETRTITEHRHYLCGVFGRVEGGGFGLNCGFGRWSFCRRQESVARSHFLLRTGRSCPKAKKKFSDKLLCPFLFWISVAPIIFYSILSSRHKIHAGFRDITDLIHVFGHVINFSRRNIHFLVVCTRLYKPLCRSVCRSVGLSVGRSVCRWRLGARDLWQSALFTFGWFK